MSILINTILLKRVDDLILKPLMILSYNRDATEGLFIYNYSEESRQLLHSLEHKEFYPGTIIERCKCYGAVYEKFIRDNQQMCKIMHKVLMYGMEL